MQHMFCILLESLNNKKRLARYTNEYGFIEKQVFSTNYKLVQSTHYPQTFWWERKPGHGFLNTMGESWTSDILGFIIKASVTSLLELELAELTKCIFLPINSYWLYFVALSFAGFDMSLWAKIYIVSIQLTSTPKVGSY